MLLLPVAGSFGIRLIPEIILVLRLGQPRPLQRAFPGLAAVRLEAIALACSTPVIGKKKTLAVQALPAGLGRLHRSQSQTEPSSERQGNQRKKIQPQEQSKRRRRKKNFQRILGRKSTGRRSILNRRFCIYSISPLAHCAFALRLDGKSRIPSCEDRRQLAFIRSYRAQPGRIAVNRHILRRNLCG